MKRGELTMTYETLLEELQGLNPNQLKQNVLIYDKIEEKFYPPEHNLNYAINNPNVKPNQPYLSF